MLFQITKKSK